MSSDATQPVRAKTISDFGDQWLMHGDVSGDHWASVDMFKDHFGDLFDPSEIKGKVVAEIGSGSGRIANMICHFSPKLLYAVEPSQGFGVLRQNTKTNKDIIQYINAPGEEFKEKDIDLVFSLGVIHHIKDPADVVKRIYDSLKPGGKFLIWLYGYEGNQAYVAFYNLVSGFTKRCPNWLLDKISFGLNVLLQPYIWLCRIFPLPMRGYMLGVFGKCGWQKRKYIIFDQLNPAYAKYYKEHEVRELLEAAGFTDIRLYHRHGYSWTAVAGKPDSPQALS